MSDVVDLPSMASQLGAALNVGDFGGGLLMTGITMAFFLFPILFFCNTKRMDPTLPALITGFVILSFSIYAYALPVWVLVMEVLLAALLLANKIRSLISGS